MRYLVLFFVLLTGSANAGVWEERALLERYLEQSKLLKEVLVVKAERSADPQARIQFDYEALNADLQGIEDKLQHYLDNPLRQFVVGGKDE